MKLTIENAKPVLSADHVVLGAVVKIIAAGGARLDKDAQRRASGLSDYNWSRKGSEVLALVVEMDTATAEA